MVCSARLEVELIESDIDLTNPFASDPPREKESFSDLNHESCFKKVVDEPIEPCNESAKLLVSDVA